MVNIVAIAEDAVALLEKFTPFGAEIAPLVDIAKSIFTSASGGLSESDLAALQTRIDAADADRERTWKEADDALDEAAKR